MKKKEGLLLAKRFAKALKAEGYPVHELILFGSVAKGVSGTHSDVDIAVICDPFLGSRLDETGRLFWIASHVDDRIEPVCLRPEDLNDKYSTLIREMKNYGLHVS